MANENANGDPSGEPAGPALVRSIRSAPPRPAPGPARHVAAFFDDPALRPVLIVLVAHIALAGALVLLGAYRTRGPLALGLLLLLLGLSADVVARAGQRRRVAFWVIAFWTLAALTAVAGDRLGVL